MSIREQMEELLESMSRKELERLAWKHAHRDYRSNSGGVKKVLYLNPKTGGTELWPLASIPEKDLKRMARIKD